MRSYAQCWTLFGRLIASNHIYCSSGPRIYFQFSPPPLFLPPTTSSFLQKINILFSDPAYSETICAILKDSLPPDILSLLEENEDTLLNSFKKQELKSSDDKKTTGDVLRPMQAVVIFPVLFLEKAGNLFFFFRGKTKNACFEIYFSSFLLRTGFIIGFRVRFEYGLYKNRCSLFFISYRFYSISHRSLG